MATNIEFEHNLRHIHSRVAGRGVRTNTIINHWYRPWHKHTLADVYSLLKLHKDISSIVKAIKVLTTGCVEIRAGWIACRAVGGAASRHAGRYTWRCRSVGSCAVVSPGWVAYDTAVASIWSGNSKSPGRGCLFVNKVHNADNEFFALQPQVLAIYMYGSWWIITERALPATTSIL